MIVIKGKSYAYSGYGYCDECKTEVCDGTDPARYYKMCINGHKYDYSKYMKGYVAPAIVPVINNVNVFFML